ncbi:RNA polymerase sigma factor [Polaribacter tangerinus]|uniref:RNA polymerase sigma factor n=1 Tax=Polaribacter tangerinus TaxID=1920034 RepID=UPI000B4BFF53|nr:RNA polymerase sigma factor [Polaribacter tangerinus]
MKIIKLHTEKGLIKKAVDNNREAQKEIFNTYSPKMLGVCRQYVKDIHHAEDLLLEGFFKVFTHLHTFKHQGNFEGWIRRIVINTCISYLRKKSVIEYTDEEFSFNDMATINLENSTVDEIQQLIDNLPNGYKIVFNLFAIEGFKHTEIAEKLGISVSTSKSQLFKARKLLQENYLKLNTIVHEKN